MCIRDSLSSARPDGSMQVKDIYWFTHSSKVGNVSSGKIKELLVYDIPNVESVERKYEDYRIRLNQEKLKEYEKSGLRVEHLEGI